MPHANNLDLWPLLFFVCFFSFPRGKRFHATGTQSVNVTLIIRAEAGQILAITSAMCRMLPSELFVAPEAPSNLTGSSHCSLFPIKTRWENPGAEHTACLGCATQRTQAEANLKLFLPSCHLSFIIPEGYK